MEESVVSGRFLGRCMLAGDSNPKNNRVVRSIWDLLYTQSRTTLRSGTIQQRPPVDKNTDNGGRVFSASVPIGGCQETGIHGLSWPIRNERL